MNKNVNENNNKLNLLYRLAKLEGVRAQPI
jgi:hypothetical protein